MKNKQQEGKVGYDNDDDINMNTTIILSTVYPTVITILYIVKNYSK